MIVVISMATREAYEASDGAGGYKRRIEMMKHRTRPLYAAQFHAEVSQPPYTDGETIMRKFFRLAGLVD